MMPASFANKLLTALTASAGSLEYVVIETDDIDSLLEMLMQVAISDGDRMTCNPIKGGVAVAAISPAGDFVWGVEIHGRDTAL